MQSLKGLLLAPRLIQLSSKRHLTLLKLSENDVGSYSSKLRSILGGDDKNVSVAEAVRNQHGQDEGPEKGSLPDIVVFPGNTEEVSEVLKLCHKDGIPLIPYGTGTGLEAGISAIQGGVCLDLSRMDQILEYHPEDFNISVQPAVTREILNHHVKNDGLWFPVDPGANASVCGMCATGASGTNTVRYGTIRDNCVNLEVVLADGSIVHTAGIHGQRPRKTSAGYDLTNLMIGSEGTLGVITQATLNLHPQPNCVSSAVVGFPSIKHAVDTVVSTLQCGIPIARIELLDEVAVKATNEYSKLDNPETPTLFIEFHASSDEALQEQTLFLSSLAEENEGSDFKWATLQEDRNKLWTARHKLFWATIGLRPGSRSVTTDVAVPISRLPEILELTRKDIIQADLFGPLLGHVGDGNFHAFLLFDPEDKDEYKRCKEVSHRMAARALEMGGTCTGEHGIGTGKIDLLKAQYGPAGIHVMKSIKNALDPKGILNPGKVLSM
eukprot:TRINITY_DN4243_c0_g1_i1.p1 TRINITY_DN4243_c0_g1~~TRINITY_DN4243_c0_g1_i1.p1  ORF type:complete len:495 (-),score=96.03 TRINITY_DN4243_c0_g1_i1:136-1620(-)